MTARAPRLAGALGGRGAGLLRQPRAKGVDDLAIQRAVIPLGNRLELGMNVSRQAQIQSDDGLIQHGTTVAHARTPLVARCYNGTSLALMRESVEIALGTISRRDKEGKRGRGLIVWAACPTCGRRRWVPLKRPEIECGPCTGRRTQVIGCRAPKPGSQSRERNNGWKGGRTHRGGYAAVLVEDDSPYRQMGDVYGYALEHRLVMAQALGRVLGRYEQVHHINGRRDDNRLSNLELWKWSHPSGVRAADYHCHGCRCMETTSE